MGFLRALILIWSLHALTAVAQQITDYSDVPLYSSLVPCAKIACDLALASIYNCQNLSPAGPYASCACIKGSNSAAISLYIKGAISGACGQGATEDASSAQAVFSSWCHAVAPNNAKPTTNPSATASTGAAPGSGVGSLATQVSSTTSAVTFGTSSTTPTPNPLLATLTSSHPPLQTETGTATSSGGNEGASSSSSSSKSLTTPEIIGIVLSAATVLLAIPGVWWGCVKRRQRNERQAAAQQQANMLHGVNGGVNVNGGNVIYNYQHHPPPAYGHGHGGVGK